jgi:hypothetical protein
VHSLKNRRAAEVLPTPPTALDPPSISDAVAWGTHQTYDPGHAPEVAWHLPDETPEDL